MLRMKVPPFLSKKRFRQCALLLLTKLVMSTLASPVLLVCRTLLKIKFVTLVASGMNLLVLRRQWSIPAVSVPLALKPLRW